jgi:hypothetical protein
MSQLLNRRDAFSIHPNMPWWLRLGCVTFLAAAIFSLGFPAWANGIDLPQRSGSPGDEITVTGHHWLTCCPENTPVERVRLFLLGDEPWPRASPHDPSDGLVLFETNADESGTIETTFTIPQVPPAIYQLKACGDDPHGNWICLPEGEFIVVLPFTGFAVWPFALAAFAFALIGVGTLISVQLSKRRDSMAKGA